MAKTSSSLASPNPTSTSIATTVGSDVAGNEVVGASLEVVGAPVGCRHIELHAFVVNAVYTCNCVVTKIAFDTMA